MGAKNIAVVCPDADKDDAINAIVGAAFGSSGQRCMAITTNVFVGAAQDWIPEVVERAKTITVGPGWENPDVVPLNSRQGLDFALNTIGDSANEGSKILLDGRGHKVDGYPDGNWLGPTIIDHVQAHMPIFRQELFSPVMLIVRLNTIEEAIQFVNDSEFGNGTAVFTRSGGNARKF